MLPWNRYKARSGHPAASAAREPSYAINHNADNALITLRYRLKDADIQMAEEPFESGGVKFSRGSFIIRGMAQADLDKVTADLGLKAYALAEAPSVKTHPARAARVAILHQWSSTQTEGWWRQAFDRYEIPYDYIDPETIRKTQNLRDKYDVIVFGPGGGQAAVEGTPLWSNPIPWRNSPEMPNVGTWAQTDDTRIGMGLEGLMHLRDFIAKGGVYIGSNSSAEFAITNNFTLWRQHGQRRHHDARRRFAPAHQARRRLQPDRVRRAGQPCHVQQQRLLLQRQRHRGRRRGPWWRRGCAAGSCRRRRHGAAAAAPAGQPVAARRTIRMSCRDARRSRGPTLSPCPSARQRSRGSTLSPRTSS